MSVPAAIVAMSGTARTAVGLIALATLLAVLVARETARAGLTDARALRAERLRFITWPLTVVFVAVVAPRIVELLR